MIFLFGAMALAALAASAVLALLTPSIKKLMGDVTNDGLVSEQSSDLTWEKFGRSLQKAEHFNEYVEFHTTNHSGLVENQTLALKLVLMATSSP